MKLRIAKIEHRDRMADEYIIQYRTWFRVWMMATFITDGAFSELHDAMTEARTWRADKKRKRKVKETWKV